MRWSKLKQLIEDRMADSLQRRVEVHTTRYRHAHDGEGRGWITVDKREVANMCEWRFWNHYYSHVQGEEGFYTHYGEIHARLREQGIMHRYDFNDALWKSLLLSIDDALRSDNVLIRAFAMLDSRLGKRRLRTLRLGDAEHPLVRQFYNLRCEAEGIEAQITTA
ncbi:MAG: SF0329 family protein [Thermomicrobiales bacterium]